MKKISALAAILVTTTACAAPSDRWDLGELYASPATWTADADRLASQLKPSASCAKGALGARAWADCLAPYAAAAQRLNALDHYVVLSKAIGENTGDLPTMEAKRNRLTSALEDWRWTLQWAWLQRPAAQRDAWLRAPALAGLRPHLEGWLREATVALQPAQQAAVRAVQLGRQGAGDLFDAGLAGIQWPKLKLADGQEADGSSPTRLADAADRRRLTQSRHATLRDQGGGPAAALSALLSEQSRLARLRGLPGSEAATLAAAGIPTTLLDALQQQTDALHPTLQRYLGLRAKALGLKAVGIADLGAPLTPLKPTLTLEAAEQVLVRSTAPLGAEMQARLQFGLEHHWMDALPREGKIPAFYNYAAYAPHPYVIANFHGKAAETQAMAHEWGHALQFDAANRHQDYLNSRTDLLIQEVASHVHELLVDQYFIEHATSPAEKRHYLALAMNRLVSNFFELSVATGFERAARSEADKGVPLDNGMLTRLYRTQLERVYAGPAWLSSAQDAGTEWAEAAGFIFYEDFAMSRLALSTAAAAQILERLHTQPEETRQAYTSLLQTGGALPPVASLRRAGLDLHSDGPYQALQRLFTGWMDAWDAID